MSRVRGRGAVAIAGIALVLSLAGCGKKAPLRLSDDRPPERAPSLRARVREGRVTLDFRVPRHRLFPEREAPWVLARILRQAASTTEVVEAGAILQVKGFAFDTPLTWIDEALAPQGSFVYRVEFRDAHRRRRSVSEPLAVSWDQVPAAPPGLTAVGGGAAIVLSWPAPIGAVAGTTFRVYRRDVSEQAWEAASPEPVKESRFIDSRVESGRDYCYTVRAVLKTKDLEVEGAASREECARAAADEPPPAHPPGTAPGVPPITP